MRLEQDPYVAEKMYFMFSTISSEDGIYKVTIEGEPTNSLIENPQAAIAAFPSGHISPLFIRTDRVDLQDYCREIINIEEPEPSSDIRMTDNLTLYELHISRLAENFLPQAMLTFCTNAKGRKIDLRCVVGISPQAVLNSFKEYSRKVLGDR